MSEPVRSVEKHDETGGYPRPDSQLGRSVEEVLNRSIQTVKNTHDGDTPRPSRPKLSPHIWPVKSPRRQKHEQLIGLFKELKNPLFEVVPDLNIGLVEKRRSATSDDFSGNLPGYPCVLAAMANKYEPLI